MDQRLLEEVARALWEEASGRPGRRIEPAALAAATDLVELYETLNEAPIAELLARFPQRVTGEDLAWYALAPGEPATQAIYVPLFRVAIEGGDLAWEGGERPARNPDPQGAAGPEPEIVLLIEDDPAMQRATTRMIKRIFPSAQVLVADNYASAVGDLQAHRVAMVVSDVNILGAESGVDVFRWVQEHQPHLVDRYVFFTGGNPQVAQVHYRYLEKPASIADLRAVIEAPGQAIRNPAAGAVDVGARIERAFDEIDGSTMNHNYVLLSDLRRALPDVSREDFDRAMNGLRRQKIMSLDSADGRHVRLSPEEREAGIREVGSVLVYAARRGR